MNVKYRVAGVAVVSWVLMLMTGCVNPDGSQNNTGTGALIGGAIGALAGAAGGGRYAGERALIGAAIGAGTGALVGHMIDQDQRERLREQSPQTLQTIDQNFAADPAKYPKEREQQFALSLTVQTAQPDDLPFRHGERDPIENIFPTKVYHLERGDR